MASQVTFLMLSFRKTGSRFLATAVRNKAGVSTEILKVIDLLSLASAWAGQRLPVHRWFEDLAKSQHSGSYGALEVIDLMKVE
jgi:hypothetical protein